MRYRIARLVPRLAVFALPSMLLVGCKTSVPPEKRVEVSNAGFQLDQLFTDGRGYTVNRFYDKGEYRYYVVGPDGGAQMLPTTKTVHDADGFGEPGFGVGVGIGGPIRRR